MTPTDEVQNDMNLDPQPEPQKEQRRDRVMEEFEVLPDKPDAAQIEQWKQLYGEVSLVSLSEDEMYIFRPIRRLEWKTLRANATDEASFQEAVVGKAVVWPQLTPTFNNSCRAGTIDTLFDLVMLNSNFLSPEMAIGLVRKL